MIDKETKNYIDPKFDYQSKRMDKLEQKFDDFKLYLETEFIFKLILGMSKVFVTGDDFDEKLDGMEIRVSNKFDSKLDNKIDGLELKLTQKIENSESKLIAKIEDLESRLTDKIDWVARKVHNDIEISHHKRLLALEARNQDT